MWSCIGCAHEMHGSLGLSGISNVEMRQLSLQHAPGPGCPGSGWHAGFGSQHSSAGLLSDPPKSVTHLISHASPVACTGHAHMQACCDMRPMPRASPHDCEVDMFMGGVAGRAAVIGENGAGREAPGGCSCRRLQGSQQWCRPCSVEGDMCCFL